MAGARERGQAPRPDGRRTPRCRESLRKERAREGALRGASSAAGSVPWTLCQPGGVCGERHAWDALSQEGTPEALAEIEKIERMAKLHVGNICHDKFSSKHEKTKASASADAPKPKVCARITRQHVVPQEASTTSTASPLLLAG